jgi:glutamate-1-semialdehyde 2,1-aminomutase
MHDKGEYFRNGIRDVLNKLDINYQVTGVESMTEVYFTDNEVYDFESAKNVDTKAFDKYFHTLLENGVFIAPSQYECVFLSSAHSLEDIDKTLDAMEIALKSL